MRAGRSHVGTDGELAPARKVGPSRHQGEYAPIIVRDNHEALIDQATFDAAQAKLKTGRLAVRATEEASAAAPGVDIYATMPGSSAGNLVHGIPCRAKVSAQSSRSTGQQWLW